jgi:transposase
MDCERAAVEFRAAVRRAGPRGAGKRYPAAAKRMATEYLRQRQKVGAPLSAVARELGVKRHTLLAWVAGPDRAAQAPGFVPVRVVAAGPARAAIVVHGPGGVRIEGLEVADVVALLRALA